MVVLVGQSGRLIAGIDVRQGLASRVEVQALKVSPLGIYNHINFQVLIIEELVQVNAKLRWLIFIYYNY